MSGKVSGPYRLLGFTIYCGAPPQESSVTWKTVALFAAAFFGGGYLLGRCQTQSKSSVFPVDPLPYDGLTSQFDNASSPLFSNCRRGELLPGPAHSLRQFDDTGFPLACPGASTALPSEDTTDAALGRNSNSLGLSAPPMRPDLVNQVNFAAGAFDPPQNGERALTDSQGIGSGAASNITTPRDAGPAVSGGGADLARVESFSTLSSYVSASTAQSFQDGEFIMVPYVPGGNIPPMISPRRAE